MSLRAPSILRTFPSRARVTLALGYQFTLLLFEASADRGLLVYELFRQANSEGTNLPTCGPSVAAKGGEEEK